MSLRAAINAKCKDCIYDPKSGLGNWRQQVEACTITGCGLWPVRPKSSGAGKSESGADLAPEQALGELSAFHEREGMYGDAASAEGQP